ncbi:MAG TPA: hypothetical protein VGF67_07625 [Ktedonobacteraceae bacterium]|jgi:hypothetical protein
MRSQVFAESYTVSQADVLYVAQQMNADLMALSQVYPFVLPITRAMSLFISYSTFLNNAAVSYLGFTIHDPGAGNLVYHEYRYEILYGGDVRSSNPTGQPLGRGGRPVSQSWLPASVQFIPWLNWSNRMLQLSIPEQEQIVSGTEWVIPSQCVTFHRRFEGGSWSSLGFYGRGNLGTNINVYSR